MPYHDKPTAADQRKRRAFIADLRRRAEAIGLLVEYDPGGYRGESEPPGAWRVIERQPQRGRKTRDALTYFRRHHSDRVSRRRYKDGDLAMMTLGEAAYVVAAESGEPTKLDWDSVDPVFEKHGLHLRSHGNRTWWEIDMGCSECREVGHHYGWCRGPALRVYINGTSPHFRLDERGTASMQIHRDHPYNNDRGRIWPRIDAEVRAKRDQWRAENVEPLVHYDPDYPSLCNLLWSQGRFRVSDLPQVLDLWLAQEIEWARQDVPPLEPPAPEVDRGPAQIFTPDVAAWRR